MWRGRDREPLRENLREREREREQELSVRGERLGDARIELVGIRVRR
jgi:hypothetical protein